MVKKREEKQDNICKKEFGRRLKMARKKSKMSSDDLGNACDVNPAFIRQIETGTKLPSILVFVKICNNLRVSPAYLLGNEVQIPVTEDGWEELARLRMQMKPPSRRIVDEVVDSLIRNLAEEDRKWNSTKEEYNIIDQEEFGRRLNKVQQEIQVTSKQGAKNCGISSSFICQLKSGTKSPKLSVFVNICKTLQISPAYLLGNELKIEVTECGWDKLVRIQCDMTPKAQQIVKDVLTLLIQNLVEEEKRWNNTENNK